MSKNKLEVRFNPSELRIASEDGKPAKLTGYAVVYNTLSCDLGGFYERIAPGSFAQSLKSGGDIRALVDHDHTKILGRTSAGTLRLGEDDKGLWIENELPDTSYARDLMASIKRGDISGMSFGFNIFPDGERWGKENDYYVRELTNIDLREVTATSIPAYLATEAYIRVSPDCARQVEKFSEKPEFSKRNNRLRQILSM